MISCNWAVIVLEQQQVLGPSCAYLESLVAGLALLRDQDTLYLNLSKRLTFAQS